MPTRDPRPRLLDILDAIEGIRSALGTLSLAEYRQSWVTRRAIERAIEIVSEASRHLPDELKASEPTIPWPEIRAIGNFIRHEYHRVDDAILYTIATAQLGDLEIAVRRWLAASDPFDELP